MKKLSCFCIFGYCLPLIVNFNYVLVAKAEDSVNSSVNSTTTKYLRGTANSSSVDVGLQAAMVYQGTWTLTNARSNLQLVAPVQNGNNLYQSKDYSTRGSFDVYKDGSIYYFVLKGTNLYISYQRAGCSGMACTPTCDPRDGMAVYMATYGSGPTASHCSGWNLVWNSDGSIKIGGNTLLSRVINTATAGKEEGAIQHLYTRNNQRDSNENWYINRLPLGPSDIKDNLIVKIVNQNSARCLDVRAANYKQGVQLIQHQCDDRSPQQKFHIRYAHSAFYIRPYSAQMVTLDVKGDTSADHAPIILWNNQNSGNQQFKFQVSHSNSVRILTNHNKCVAVKDASTSVDALMIQHSCNGREISNDNWFIYKIGSV